MANFGIFATEKATSLSTPVQATSGIPFAIGTAPLQAATDPAKVGRPVLCTSYDEAVAKLGMSMDWKHYTLCEVIYSHFQLYAAQPVIFCNVLDPNTDKTTLAAAEEGQEVVDHKISVPFETIASGLTVTDVTETEPEEGKKLTQDIDYTVVYGTDECYIELLSSSEHYESAKKLKVSGSKVTLTETDLNTWKPRIIAGLNQVDACLSSVSIVPDLIIAPGFSQDTEVAAVMAAKAGNISGLFKGKAIIDISTAKEGGVTDYANLAEQKSKNNFTSPNEIVCWPMIALGDNSFHLSTQLAGLIAATDTKNSGVPYEAASNLNLQMDKAVLADGTEVDLTLEQANIVRTNGIVTALNFADNGWVSWGTYTGAAPGSTDVKDYIYSIGRTMGFIGNTAIRTFWSKVDRPLTKVLIDNIVTSFNIWLSGLTGSGHLLGARAVLEEAENPLTDLMAGRIKIHVYLAPPSPMHECDFIVEYDPSIVNDVMSAMMAA